MALLHPTAFKILFPMMRIIILLLLCVSPLSAQQQSGPRAERNTRLLLERVAKAPRLNFEGYQFRLQSPKEGWRIDEPSSVAVGKDGVYYVLQRGAAADPVVAFDSDGSVLRSWGSGLYTIPHSIRVDPAGDIWTVDSGNSQVYKFSPQGEQLLHIDVGEMPDVEGQWRGTSDIAFAKDGNLLIADGYGNARILEYTPDGRRVHEFGKSGTQPGELRLPHAVEIDERDIVYVGDRENGRIQRFTRQGEFIDQWDGLGKTYCLQLDGNSIWMASHPLDQADSDWSGWVLQLDRDSGTVQGLVESAGTHSIALTALGEPLTGVWPDQILRFRKGR